MTTVGKLFDVSVVDVISIPLAIVLVAWFTGGLTVAGVIGVIIANRIWSVFSKD